MYLFKFNCFFSDGKLFYFFEEKITPEYILDLGKIMPTVSNPVSILFTLSQNKCKNIDVAVLADSKKEAKNKIRRWHNQNKQ